MNKRTVLFILLGGVFFLSACGERSCVSGAQLRSPWDALALPEVEGGKICFSYDNMLGIVHYKASPMELIQRYQSEYEKSGWSVQPEAPSAGSDMRFLKAVKGDKKLSLSASACTRFPLAQYFSKCGLIQVSETKNPD